MQKYTSPLSERGYDLIAGDQEYNSHTYNQQDKYKIKYHDSSSKTNIWIKLKRFMMHGHLITSVNHTRSQNYNGCDTVRM